MIVDDVLTVPEVAAAFRCSKSNIYERVRTGEIPSLRLGATVRIPARYVADVMTAALSPAERIAEHTGNTDHLAMTTTVSPSPATDQGPTVADQGSVA